MKKLIYAAALPALIYYSNTAYAQRTELGLSGGIAWHTGAGGSIHYKADKSGTGAIGAITFVANLEKHPVSKITTQLGLSIHVLKLASKSADTFTYFAQTIGNDGTKFVYADPAISICPVFNIKYKLSKIQYIYGGVAIGIAGSRNNTNRSAAEFAGAKESYTAPDGGLGFCTGMQVGYTHRLNQRLAFNAEVAMRYYNLKFNVEDFTYPGGTSFSYNTLTVPVTVGLRYRMGWEKELNRGTNKYELLPEELEEK